MIASADAGFENIWSLQDCIETLYEFGDEDQRSRFIPRVCAGETMSMDLTEPDAGSDLQRVMFKATYSEKMAQNFVFQKIYLTLFFFCLHSVSKQMKKSSS